MSVENYLSIGKRNTTQGLGAGESIGKINSGMADPSGVSPQVEKIGQYGINESQFASGKNVNMPDDVDPEVVLGDDVEYGKSYLYETPGGHQMQYNDTPGNERILIRHKSGSGVQICPDGSVIVSSSKRVDIIGEDYKLSAGNGSLDFNGNLTINVQGDFNVNVGGSYNVNAKTKNENISGNSNTRVSGGDSNTIVDGNVVNTTTGITTHTYLGNLTQSVKGESLFIAENGHEASISGDLVLTSDNEVVLSSPNTNIAADNLSMFGGSGTIGGTGMVFSGAGAVFEEGVTAPTFHGDLKGTSEKAITSDITNSQNYADPDTDAGSAGNQGSAQGYVIDEVDTPDITKPTSENVSDYLSNSNKGIRQVKVDSQDVIKNSINNLENTGGVTGEQLSTGGVRRKMREAVYRENEKFVSSAIASGSTSPNVIKSNPSSVGQTVDVSDPVIRGKTPLGNVEPHQVSKIIKGK